MAIDKIGTNGLVASAIVPPDGSITSAKIANDAVITTKIAADAVTSAKIPAGAVVASDVADGSVTTAKLADSAVTSAKALNLGRRNIIINGSMTVAQRGTSSTGVGYQTVDRFAVNQSGFDNLVSTKTQDTNVPAGFSKSLKLATTTAETALAADEYGNMSYAIEAQDLQSLAYGTSSAKSFTLSFYVKSNLTGNFSVTAYKQTGSNKQQDRRYTINTTNTWERKTLTFVGDTAQAIVNDNTAGMYLYWHTAFGSNFGTATYSASAGWSAYANAGWGAGQDNNTLFNSTSNYIQFTGIQLEVGDTVTDFEHRSFEEELHACKRYYQKSFIYSTTPANAGNTTTNVYDGNITGYCGSNNSGIYSGGQPFSPEMRATPSMTTYGNSNGHWGQMIPTNTGSVSYSAGAGYIGHVRANGFSVGQNISSNILMIGFGQWTANAEL